MLLGQYQTKIDIKGRTALPVKFRNELGEKIIICRWYEKSLAIFSEASWLKVIDLAVGEAILTEPTRDTERFLLGGAYESECDSQGRIILPAVLRSFAEIGNELVFLGLRDRVEVWSKKLWDERERGIIKSAAILIEEVQKAKLQMAKRQ